MGTVALALANPPLTLITSRCDSRGMKCSVTAPVPTADALHRGVVEEQDERLQDVPQDTASFFSIPVTFVGENGFSLLMPAYLFVVQGKNPDCDKYLTMIVA